jgi:hypothetical protein
VDGAEAVGIKEDALREAVFLDDRQAELVENDDEVGACNPQSFAHPGQCQEAIPFLRLNVHPDGHTAAAGGTVPAGKTLTGVVQEGLCHQTNLSWRVSGCQLGRGTWHLIVWG